MKKPTKKAQYCFRLIQGGVIVAAVSCSVKALAQKEINHYAMMYAQDGPVKIVEVKRKGRGRR